MTDSSTKNLLFDWAKLSKTMEETLCLQSAVEKALEANDFVASRKVRVKLIALKKLLAKFEAEFDQHGRSISSSRTTPKKETDEIS